MHAVGAAACRAVQQQEFRGIKLPGARRDIKFRGLAAHHHTAIAEYRFGVHAHALPLLVVIETIGAEQAIAVQQTHRTLQPRFAVLLHLGLFGGQRHLIFNHVTNRGQIGERHLCARRILAASLEAQEHQQREEAAGESSHERGSRFTGDMVTAPLSCRDVFPYSARHD